MIASTVDPEDRLPAYLGQRGAGSVDGQLHARSLTVESASEELARQFGLDASTGAFGANAIRDEYEQLLDAGLAPRAHTYLWRHGWRHLAEAGQSGLAALRKLVERDRSAFLPHLAAGLELAATTAYAAGSSDEALALNTEAVELRRELGDALTLAMALFGLAFAQSAAGQAAAADASATEALTAARKAEGPESRGVLGAVLIGRAHTQLVEGRYRAASYLEKKRSP